MFYTTVYTYSEQSGIEYNSILGRYYGFPSFRFLPRPGYTFSLISLSSCLENFIISTEQKAVFMSPVSPVFHTIEKVTKFLTINSSCLAFNTIVKNPFAG